MLAEILRSDVQPLAFPQVPLPDRLLVPPVRLFLPIGATVRQQGQPQGFKLLILRVPFFAGRLRIVGHHHRPLLVRDNRFWTCNRPGR